MQFAGCIAQWDDKQPLVHTQRVRLDALCPEVNVIVGRRRRGSPDRRRALACLGVSQRYLGVACALCGLA